jgi:hypothetical protein
MTNLYFKNNKVLPKHKINDMNGWKELEYDIPAYNKETHRIEGYDFEELSNKVVAHAIIVEIVEMEEYISEEQTDVQHDTSPE